MSNYQSRVEELIENHAKYADAEATSYGVVLQAIVHERLHVALPNEHLTRLIDEGIRSSLASNGRFLELFVGVKGRLDLVVVSSQSKNLFSSPAVFSQLLISDSPVRVDVYKAICKDPSWLDSGAKLELSERRNVMPGEVVEKPLWTVLDSHFQPPRKQLFLRLTGQGHHGYEWEYDRRTLLPWRLHSVDTRRSNLLAVLHLLSDVGEPSSIPVVERLLADEAHFIRWASLRTLIRLDSDGAHNRLHFAAQNDDHPEIRSLAQQLLEGGCHNG